MTITFLRFLFMFFKFFVSTKNLVYVQLSIVNCQSSTINRSIATKKGHFIGVYSTDVAGVLVYFGFGPAHEDIG